MGMAGIDLENTPSFAGTNESEAARRRRISARFAEIDEAMSQKAREANEMVATEDRVRDAIGLGVRRSSLLTDGEPSEVYPVEVRRAAFWPADDIRHIARAIISAYPVKFEALSQFRGVYYWQADGGETNGQPNYGGVKLIKGITRELTRGDGTAEPADYVITVSAEWVAALAMTRMQVEALVFRLLCHLLVDEKGKLRLVQPDIVAFRSEIIEYGDWNAELQKARDAFTQLPLWQG